MDARMPTPPIRLHRYRRDPDSAPHPYWGAACLCGLPKRNRVHVDLADVDLDAARERDAAILGEREEGP